MENKLKPCPFCGSKDIIYDEYFYDGQFYYIKCSECRCFTDEFASKEEARNAWNTRVKEQKQ